MRYIFTAVNTAENVTPAQFGDDPVAAHLYRRLKMFYDAPDPNRKAILMALADEAKKSAENLKPRTH